MRLVVVLLFLVVSIASFGQSKKKRAEEGTNAPTSLNPSFPSEQYAPKKTSSKKKSKKSGPTYESEQQYYERMARLEKTRKKNEKLMEKPQYSNPMYFGHKRPPKKHKAGKLKFCKECGMRH